MRARQHTCYFIIEGSVGGAGSLFGPATASGSFIRLCTGDWTLSRWFGSAQCDRRSCPEFHREAKGLYPARCGAELPMLQKLWDGERLARRAIADIFVDMHQQISVLTKLKLMNCALASRGEPGCARCKRAAAIGRRRAGRARSGRREAIIRHEHTMRTALQANSREKKEQHLPRLALPYCNWTGFIAAHQSSTRRKCLPARRIFSGNPSCSAVRHCIGIVFATNFCNATTLVLVPQKIHSASAGNST